MVQTGCTHHAWLRRRQAAPGCGVPAAGAQRATDAPRRSAAPQIPPLPASQAAVAAVGKAAAAAASPAAAWGGQAALEALDKSPRPVARWDAPAGLHACLSSSCATTAARKRLPATMWRGRRQGPAMKGIAAAAQLPSRRVPVEQHPCDRHRPLQRKLRPRVRPGWGSPLPPAPAAAPRRPVECVRTEVSSLRRADRVI